MNHDDGFSVVLLTVCGREERDDISHDFVRIYTYVQIPSFVVITATFVSATVASLLAIVCYE